MTIAEALADIGIDVCHPPYRGKHDTYITYQLIGQDGQIYANGKEAETGVSYSVDLYGSFFNPTTLTNIKSALEAAGYSVVVEMEYYDSQKDKNQISMIATVVGAEYG